MLGYVVPRGVLERAVLWWTKRIICFLLDIDETLVAAYDMQKLYKYFLDAKKRRCAHAMMRSMVEAAGRVRYCLGQLSCLLLRVQCLQGVLCLGSCGIHAVVTVHVGFQLPGIMHAYIMSDCWNAGRRPRLSREKPGGVLRRMTPTSSMSWPRPRR